MERCSLSKDIECGKDPGLGTEVSVTVPDTGPGRPRRTRGVNDDDQTLRDNSLLALRRKAGTSRA